MPSTTTATASSIRPTSSVLDLTDEHDLAEAGVALHALVRTRGVGERHDLIDHRLEQTACEERHDLELECAHRGDLLLERTRAQNGAEDPRALAQHESEIEIAFGAGHQTDEHDATERCDAAQILGDVCATDELKDHARAVGCERAHR